MKFTASVEALAVHASVRLWVPTAKVPGTTTKAVLTLLITEPTAVPSTAKANRPGLGAVPVRTKELP